MYFKPLTYYLCRFSIRCTFSQGKPLMLASESSETSSDASGKQARGKCPVLPLGLAEAPPPSLTFDKDNTAPSRLMVRGLKGFTKRRNTGGRQSWWER